jgi:hypothetical protein
MKKIASFGAWVIDFWWLLIPMFVGIITAIYCYNAPKTVTLDAKHWECTMTRPDGLGAKCLEYVYKGK